MSDRLYFILPCVFFFFKQKTAYEVRIRDWSSDVCSSDLMGMSPHQYVVRRRIERAKYLLGYTQEPIAQIAHGCGFSHQEHLSGMFRRHVGETPARYRRRKRGAATR